MADTPTEIVVTEEMMKEDEEFLDGKDAMFEAPVEPEPKLQGESALQKLLSVAETVSNFYSAQGGGVSKLPQGFKGELYEYQKKVCLHVRVCASVCACARGVCRQAVVPVVASQAVLVALLAWQ